MNYLNLADLKKLRKDEIEIVLRFEGTTATAAGYNAPGMIASLEEIAKEKVSDGDFETFEKAMEYLDSVVYVCRKSDYDAEQIEFNEL